LKYALRRSGDLPVNGTWWDTYQGLVLSVVSAEPTATPVGLDLLRQKSQEIREPVDKEALAEVVESQIMSHAPLRNGSEVAWALWAAISFEVDLTKDVAKLLAAMGDNFVALLALDAQAKGRFPSTDLDLTNWETLVGAADAPNGQHWLLAYEGTAQGWLESARPGVERDSFLSILKDRDVRFYDTEP
jgi:hypothetical protein